MQWKIWNSKAILQSLFFVDEKLILNRSYVYNVWLLRVIKSSIFLLKVQYNFIYLYFFFQIKHIVNVILKSFMSNLFCNINETIRSSDLFHQMILSFHSTPIRYRFRRKREGTVKYWQMFKHASKCTFHGTNASMKYRSKSFLRLTLFRFTCQFYLSYNSFSNDVPRKCLFSLMPCKYVRIEFS